MRYTLLLTLTVRAPSAEAAHAIGIGAAEHLADTFNDDNSIGALILCMVEPSPDQRGPAPSAEFEEACLANMEEEGLTRSDAQGIYDANKELAEWLFASGVPGDVAALDILAQVAP